jgi:hypothetical protein
VILQVAEGVSDDSRMACAHSFVVTSPSWIPTHLSCQPNLKHVPSRGGVRRKVPGSDAPNNGTVSAAGEAFLCSAQDAAMPRIASIYAASTPMPFQNFS